MQFSVDTLKGGALVFWALWLTIICFTNAADLLKQLGVLGKDWKFASGNYDLMKQETAAYGVSDPLLRLLFAGVIVWQAVAALLMWNAFVMFRGAITSAVYAAFGVSLALWAAFMIVDEIFAAYDPETTHVRMFIAQLVTLIAVCVLPAAT